jgi:hypothetical protein
VISSRKDKTLRYLKQRLFNKLTERYGSKTPKQRSFPNKHPVSFVVVGIFCFCFVLLCHLSTVSRSVFLPTKAGMQTDADAPPRDTNSDLNLQTNRHHHSTSTLFLYVGIYLDKSNLLRKDTLSVRVAVGCKINQWSHSVPNVS